MKFDNRAIHHIKTGAENFMEAIPSPSEDPVAIILLYFPKSQRRRHDDLYLSKATANTDGNTYSPKKLHFMLANTIREFTVDAFVYGKKCNLHQLNQLKRVVHGLPRNNEEFLVQESLTCDDVLKKSFSRCSNTNSGFSKKYFSAASLSPGEPNHCKFTLTPVFSFRGFSLEKSAKQVLINVWNGLLHSKKHPEILQGVPSDVAARLTGVHSTTMKRVHKQWLEKSCVTGAKPVVQPKRKLLTFDNFDKSTVRNILTKSYEEGRVITFPELYNEFMRVKEETRNEEIRLKRLHPELPEVGETFTCCLKTFKKFVKLLGYKYGKIDTRASIIQRPDIVQWRGRYLRRLRENAASENPKKIIYSDETWIDVNGRIAKGWMPKSCERKKEMALFTFKNQKVGRGKYLGKLFCKDKIYTKIGTKFYLNFSGARLIVLAAVEEDGIVEELILVDKVLKSAVADDYHDNVNKDGFLDWFRRLIAYLNSKGEEYIIVM